jgi:hypothetical protein
MRLSKEHGDALLCSQKNFQLDCILLPLNLLHTDIPFSVHFNGTAIQCRVPYTSGSLLTRSPTILFSRTLFQRVSCLTILTQLRFISRIYQLNSLNLFTKYLKKYSSFHIEIRARDTV